MTDREPGHRFTRRALGLLLLAMVVCSSASADSVFQERYDRARALKITGVALAVTGGVLWGRMAPEAWRLEHALRVEHLLSPEEIESALATNPSTGGSLVSLGMRTAALLAIRGEPDQIDRTLAHDQWVYAGPRWTPRFIYVSGGVVIGFN